MRYFNRMEFFMSTKINELKGIKEGSALLQSNLRAQIRGLRPLMEQKHATKKGLAPSFWSPFKLGDLLVWERKEGKPLLPKVDDLIKVINDFNAGNAREGDGVFLYVIPYDEKTGGVQSLRCYWTVKKELFTVPKEVKERPPKGKDLEGLKKALQKVYENFAGIKSPQVEQLKAFIEGIK